jgi:leucine dehydrogenase
MISWRHPMFESEAFDAHESVTFFNDAASGLRAIVAIHSTALGPAMGGCRAWTYADSQAALTDALRLSRGMSFKNAIAGLPLGGGKAVILRRPGEAVTDAQFEAFGDVVQRLGGRYVTAEDVGVSVANMASVARRTSYVSGLPPIHDSRNAGGDPSPHTARGTFLGIRAAVRARLGRSGLAGVTVAVQGLGHVGRHLCEYLHRAGAELVVADLDPASVEHVCAQWRATAVHVDDILFQNVDVVAPCALGAVLDEASIGRLEANVVAGAANNQLRSDADGQRLFDAGVLYAPDYVINAGGIIACGLDYLGGNTAGAIAARVANIETTLEHLFETSRATRRPPHVLADAMARELLSAGGTESARRAA